MKHNALFYKVAKNANKLNDFSISDYDDIKKILFYLIYLFYLILQIPPII
jgi:hypothetical protein